MQALVHDFRETALPPKERAMLEYVAKITLAARLIVEEDVRRLREHGFSDLEIFDMVHVASYFNYINRMADGLGVPL